jgi:hypothetical protein
MRKVVNIRRPLIEPCADELERELREQGQVIRRLDDLGGLSPAEWLRA